FLRLPLQVLVTAQVLVRCREIEAQASHTGQPQVELRTPRTEAVRLVQMIPRFRIALATEGAFCLPKMILGQEIDRDQPPPQADQAQHQADRENPQQLRSEAGSGAVSLLLSGGRRRS